MIVLHWVSSEAEPQTRIWVQIIYLGVAPEREQGSETRKGG